MMATEKRCPDCGEVKPLGLIESQGGLCAVCRSAPATQVDHDHQNGRIRGILCLHCNAGMGAFEDDPNITLRAIEYLERSDGTRLPDWMPEVPAAQAPRGVRP